MMTALKVKAGDAVELGKSRFRVAAVLTLEPDRGVSFMNFAPRILVRVEDLPATGLVQPQSRINYQLLAAGDRAAIQRFEQWARSRLGRGERVDSLENARPEVRSAWIARRAFSGWRRCSRWCCPPSPSPWERGATPSGTSTDTPRCAAWARPSRSCSRCSPGSSCCSRCSRRPRAAFSASWCRTSSRGGSPLSFRSLPQPGPAPVGQGAATGLSLLLGFALPPLLQLRMSPRSG